ncbi:tyrosine-type recombinase/integrase [Bifidobacterium dentium]|uniref:tyrosine-type recombinase/integrase n=1 Tax=Bifidobacterium dentium TaxID=1689 RepID=UPI001F50A07B|nr:tyrosine-type recombinase/integrase [Bifidobacterium dentium]
MRARVTDLWLKPDAPARYVKMTNDLSPETAAARIPEKYKTSRFGKWKRWRVGWRESDGRQRTESFESKKDAQALADAVNAAFLGGTYKPKESASHSVEEAASAWLTSKLDVKATTANRYRRELKNYVLQQWGSKPVSSITTSALQSWTADLAAGRAKTACTTRTALAPASIRNIVKVVTGGVLDYAVEQGWTSVNPAKKVVLPKDNGEREDKVFLTVQQVERLADAAASYITKPRLPLDSHENANSALIRFLAYTGCRVGEATAIQVGDVDTNARRVTIKRTWTEERDSHKKTLGSPKNGKSRVIAYPGFLDDDIKNMINEKATNEWLFTTARGLPITVGDWRNRVWRHALAKCGLDGEDRPNIHSLRHTYAALAIQAGCDVKTLQQQLGHSSAQITLDVYAFLFPDRLTEVADAISAERERALASS